MISALSSPAKSCVKVPRVCAGFSLLEVLVAGVVLVLVSVLSFSVIQGVSMAWKQQKERVGAFAKARVGFELLGERLAQATLNTYWDYDDPGSPTRYIRQSELHYLQGRASELGISGGVTDAVFFIAPLGFTQDSSMHPLFKMLTATGFFIRFSRDEARPTFLDGRFPPRWRYRLFQFLQPGEGLSVYADTASPNSWFQTTLADHSFPLAENVIGLVLRARYPTQSATVESYVFDSRAASLGAPQSHQLPPVVSVTMVVLSEESAGLLEDKFGDSAPPIAPPSTSFQDPEFFARDLGDWEEMLSTMQPALNYRIFQADIPIRGARWSMD